MSTFAYATASKGLLLWTGLVSVIGSTFGRKYLFHLQLSPHITRDHQFWRLISRNLAFTNSIDLLISILLLYRASVLLEQRYGTAKFVSFAMVSSTMGTALEMLALFAGHRFGLNYLPAGPYTLVFSILYNYSRSVPTAYTYKVFGVQFSSKSLTYILSLLLVFAVPPNSIVSAACGVLAGMMYRANVLGSRQWRIPKWLRKLSTRFLAPSLASTSIPRRSTRTALRPDRTEVAPRPRGPLTPGPTRQGAISEVMQTFASTRTDATPSAEAVAQLRAMFPNATTEQVNSALQRGGNDVSRSVEYLL